MWLSAVATHPQPSQGLSRTFTALSCFFWKLKLRQGILDGAQEPFVLELLLLALPLGLPSLLLFLPPLSLLGGLLGGFTLLLLGLALGLLVLVTGHGAEGLLGPSLELLVHSEPP